MGQLKGPATQKVHSNTTQQGVGGTGSSPRALGHRLWKASAELHCCIRCYKVNIMQKKYTPGIPPCLVPVGPQRQLPQPSTEQFKSWREREGKAVKAIHVPSKTVPAFPADGIDFELYHFLCRKRPILCSPHFDVCQHFCLYALIKAYMLIVCISPFSCY